MTFSDIYQILRDVMGQTWQQAAYIIVLFVLFVVALYWTLKTSGSNKDKNKP